MLLNDVKADGFKHTYGYVQLGILVTNYSTILIWNLIIKVSNYSNWPIEIQF